MQTARAPNKRVLPARRHHLALLKTLPGELTGVAHAVADAGSAIADAISWPAPHTGDISFAGDMREDADAMAECPFRSPCDRQRGGNRRNLYHLAESSRPPDLRLGSMPCVRTSVLLDFIAAQGTWLVHPAASRAKSCGQVYAERMLLRLTTSSRAFFLQQLVKSLLTLTPFDGRLIGCRGEDASGHCKRKTQRKTMAASRGAVFMSLSCCGAAGFLQRWNSSGEPCRLIRPAHASEWSVRPPLTMVGACHP